jgi:hypothetical protein
MLFMKLSGSRQGRIRGQREVRRVARYIIEQLEERLQLSAALQLSTTGTQTPTVIGDSNGVQVSSSSDGLRQAESAVAVDPSNPMYVAACTVDGLYAISVFRSADGGKTWNETVINKDIDGHHYPNDPTRDLGRVDPSVAYDNAGRLYLSYQYSGSTLWTLYSTDHGVTFQNPSVFPSTLADFPHIAAGIDSSGNQVAYIAYYDKLAGHNNLYVIGTNDGGANWTSTPVKVPEDGTFGQYGIPAVGSNGSLGISYVGAHIRFRRDPDGLFGSQPWDASVDTGVSYSVGATKPAQGGRFFNGAPILGVDRTNGNLYIAYPGDTTYPNSSIFLIKSTGNGATWTAPITVDGSNATNFLPWLDVDQATGTVSVLYYTTDGVSDPNNTHKPTQPRLATSFDGGATFSRIYLSQRVSTTADSSLNFGYGDYMGLAVYDGTAHGVWSSYVGPTENNFELFTANAAFVSSANNNQLTINATSSADTLTVHRSPINADYVEVLSQSGSGPQKTEYAGLFQTLNKIVVNGLDGDDVILMDAGEGLPVTVDGGNGSDRLEVTGATTNDTLSFSTSSAILNGSTITLSNLETKQLDPSSGADSVTVSSGTLNVGGTGITSIFGSSSTLTVSSGATANFNSDAGSSSARNLALTVTGLANFNTTQHLNTLTINSGGWAGIAVGSHTSTTHTYKNLVLNSLAIANSGSTWLGKLDMQDNALIIKGGMSVTGALDNIVSQVKSARGSGFWTGNGITSTAAAGYTSHRTGLAVLPNDRAFAYGSGSGAILTSLNGESVGTGEILIKYTWNGDLDLTGKIDSDDYFRIDNGFATGKTTYWCGDLDFSTHVDGDDYFLIDGAYASQGSLVW